ncbi:hypothetical protein HDU93_007174, partial [Gonapodya sp. JEL0774]
MSPPASSVPANSALPSENPPARHLTLADILDGRVSDLPSADEHDGETETDLATLEDADRDADTDGDAMDMSRSQDPNEGGVMCAECEDHPADLLCSDCDDPYCDVCFTSQHRKGKRAAHRTSRLRAPTATTAAAASATGKTNREPSDEVREAIPGVETWESEEEDAEAEKQAGDTNAETAFGEWFVERAKYIPLRLTLEERKYLRLLEAALLVSEYTDKVDVLTYTSRTKRAVAQIKELCSIVSGLVLAADYGAGQKLFADRDFASNEAFYQSLFEFGRRHKIQNPEKMRATYGKLVHVLMDAQSEDVKEQLGFSCVKPLKTVYSTLEEGGATGLLRDPLVEVATMEIKAEGKQRFAVQQEIRKKERAIETLARRYATADMPADAVRQCLYSIGDNHAYLRYNRDPCDKMLEWLNKYFSPESHEGGYNLAIQMGRGGARLSHDHTRQFHYVSQSLSLWREIAHDMYMLWYLAEQDLLDEDHMYRLRDTGQGLNRVQAAPRVSRAMHSILNKAQKKLGYWVGSSGESVVLKTQDGSVLLHRALHSQVARILGPLCLCLEQLDRIVLDPGVANYIKQTFGGVEKLRKDILLDFFRHAFDGSGADNFFDAGSCIDGRLTSAWNWCSKIEKKP